MDAKSQSNCIFFNGCCRDECLSDVFVLNELDFLRLDFDVFDPYGQPEASTSTAMITVNRLMMSLKTLIEV